MGQEIINIAPNSKDARINIAHLANGLYIVNVITGDVAKTVKIIKQ